MHRLAFAILALVCSLPVFAAPPKPKLAEQYKRWLDQDVVYIAPQMRNAKDSWP